MQDINSFRRAGKESEEKTRFRDLGFVALVLMVGVLLGAFLTSSKGLTENKTNLIWEDINASTESFNNLVANKVAGRLEENT